MPPSFFSPDTTWTGTQILLSEQHCACHGDFPFTLHVLGSLCLPVGGYMAELRIDKPTLIAKVEGAVFVMDADGSLRRATPGMQLEPGMRLLTESDGQVELAEAGSERPEPT